MGLDAPNTLANSNIFIVLVSKIKLHLIKCIPLLFFFFWTATWRPFLFFPFLYYSFSLSDVLYYSYIYIWYLEFLSHFNVHQSRLQYHRMDFPNGTTFCRLGAKCCLCHHPPYHCFVVPCPIHLGWSIKTTQWILLAKSLTTKHLPHIFRVRTNQNRALQMRKK